MKRSELIGCGILLGILFIVGGLFMLVTAMTSNEPGVSALNLVVGIGSLVVGAITFYGIYAASMNQPRPVKSLAAHPAQTQTSLEAELNNLHDLHKRGVIDENEYQTLRKKLIERQ